MKAKTGGGARNRHRRGLNPKQQKEECKTPMDIMEFLKTRRTYRRFEQKPVEPAIAREIMEPPALPAAVPTARR